MISVVPSDDYRDRVCPAMSDASSTQHVQSLMHVPMHHRMIVADGGRALHAIPARARAHAERNYLPQMAIVMRAT